ncbi:hypothetical protein ANN_22141 [Periplaneta americana]|uniref:Uncharacterized protein n=1 Tax=Periplaneta americana TaxID=6978 RepID=A0ABQ8S8A0_PERAM|nr:hypothetical protein ANN_22141 [Periplaneta americana]
MDNPRPIQRCGNTSLRWDFVKSIVAQEGYDTIDNYRMRFPTDYSSNAEANVTPNMATIFFVRKMMEHYCPFAHLGHTVNLVLFSDECTFTNHGEVNRHNMHCWAVENPRWFQSQMWYQHDGCPAYYAHTARDVLNNNYHGRWIGRAGPINWPARSPDLTSPDFFLWGYLKEIQRLGESGEKVHGLRDDNISDSEQKSLYEHLFLTVSEKTNGNNEEREKCRIRKEAMLERVGEERIMLKLIKKEKINWLGHWPRNCLLKDALEEVVNGRKVGAEEDTR